MSEWALLDSATGQVAYNLVQRLPAQLRALVRRTAFSKNPEMFLQEVRKAYCLGLEKCAKNSTTRKNIARNFSPTPRKAKENSDAANFSAVEMLFRRTVIIDVKTDREQQLCLKKDKNW